MDYDNIPACFQNVDDAFDCDYSGFILIGNCLVKLIHNQRIPSHSDYGGPGSIGLGIHSNVLLLY